MNSTRAGLKASGLLRLAALLGMMPLIAAANPQDFSVQAVNRPGSFRLSDARGQYVALHFLLKTECPFCMKYTRDYALKAPAVPGVVHVFLKPDSEAEITAWNTKLASDGVTSVAIYRDADARLADAYGIPNGYSFHKQIVHYPALVILDPTGKEVFRYVGKSNADRFSFEQFSAKMSELRRGAGAPR